MMILVLLKLFFVTPTSALCIAVDKADLMAEPNSKSEVLWTVGKFTPLHEVSQKGSWLQVQPLDGKKYWISSKLVSRKIDCAAVKVKKTILRQGPGNKFPLTDLGYAYKYDSFRKIERDDAWLKLRDDYGFVHWVHEKNLWEPLMYKQVVY